MPLGSILQRDESRVGVLLVTGSCCIPGMAPFDEQARRVVTQAAAETGVPVQLREIPATTAFFGGVPKSVMAGLLATFNQNGTVGLPAILINGELVAAGVPDVATIKAALLRVAGGEPRMEEHAHG